MTGFTASQRAGWERRMNRNEAIFIVRCDGAKCYAAHEGTAKDRKKAGWIRTWRSNGTGLEQQIDLCPRCRKPRKR